MSRVVDDPQDGQIRTRGEDDATLPVADPGSDRKGRPGGMRQMDAPGPRICLHWHESQPRSRQKGAARDESLRACDPGSSHRFSIPQVGAGDVRPSENQHQDADYDEESDQKDDADRAAKYFQHVAFLPTIILKSAAGEALTLSRFRRCPVAAA